MKPLLAAFLFLATDALAHPGHGRSGWLHFHEFSDGALVVIGLATAAAAYWAWKK